jgi:hypothetical protein
MVARMATMPGMATDIPTLEDIHTRIPTPILMDTDTRTMAVLSAAGAGVGVMVGAMAGGAVVAMADFMAADFMVAGFMVAVDFTAVGDFTAVAVGTARLFSALTCNDSAG